MKSIYDSPYHHPLAAYLAALVLLLWIARRLPFLYSYLVVFLFTIAADATVTGSFSPVPLDSPAYTVFSVLFIILGDFRYFFLAERVTRPSEPWPRSLPFSSAVTMFMPVATGIMTRTIDAMADTRVLYIVYEGAMVPLVLGLNHFRFARRSIDEPTRRFVREVSYLFAGLYFGWALSDVCILAGAEWGHLLRIVPNVLYYAVFLVFVFARAPAALKALR